MDKAIRVGTPQNYEHTYK